MNIKNVRRVVKSSCRYVVYAKAALHVCLGRPTPASFSMCPPDLRGTPTFVKSASEVSNPWRIFSEAQD